MTYCSQHLLSCRNVRPISNDILFYVSRWQVNPFRTQICAVFSSEDKSMMSLIDFLDMISVFSPKASDYRRSIVQQLESSVLEVPVQ